MKKIVSLPPIIERARQELAKLPTIGSKSALRLIFHLLAQNKEEVNSLAQTLLDLNRIKQCKNCFNLSEDDLCTICQDPSRDHSRICVVEKVQDLINIEKTGYFTGAYHILQGLISPLEGINPEDIRIAELKKRVESQKINELILALNPTVEGDTTALYIAELFKTSQIRISRLAYGLSAGSEVENADIVTLSRAIEGRKEIEL